MKKLLIISCLLFSFISFSQQSVLDIKEISELTKQDMYALGQTYAEATYKSGLGNGIAGFFFGPIAKSICSISDKSPQMIQKILRKRNQSVPGQVLANPFFVKGFNATRKQKAIHSMRAGELANVAFIILLITQSTDI